MAREVPGLGNIPILGHLFKFQETITEYTNQKGVLCVTARSVGVETEKAVEQ